MVDIVFLFALAVAYTAALVWYCSVGGNIGGAVVIGLNIIAVLALAWHLWKNRRDKSG